MIKTVFFVLCALAVVAQATVLFEESFDGSWASRWVLSKAKGDEAGKFQHLAKEHWEGIQTSEDNRFYQASAVFPEFSNKGKTLVLQYEIRNEQVMDCGGAYLKFGPAGLEQESFHGESQYNIMFGMDKCGSSTNKIHFIMAKDGTNHLTTKAMTPKSDQLSHVYTLILKDDNTWRVLVDGEETAAGTLEDDFDILPPKEINDPAASKPADWVDQAMIEDPEDVKPADWDDTPATIEDKDAVKPADWDDDLDGTWEVPQIPNPAFRGEWKAKMIPNPAYKGPWVHPKIANPDYAPRPDLYAFESFGYAAIDVWQVKSGTVFKSVFISDSEDEAAAHRERTWANTQAAEKEIAEAEKAAAAEAAKKAAEEAAAAAAADDKEEL